MKLPIARRTDACMLEWLQRLGQMGRCVGMHVYLVGGPVRDLLLGRPLLDTDLAVEGDALLYAHRVAEAEHAELVEYPQFESATVILPDGRRVDITAARSETYCEPGALPQVARADILQDLARRDFTLNAMAVSLHPDSFAELVDPHGGYRHLQQHCLQALHPRSFRDDPTRILRAARFCARLNLTPHAETAAWLREAVADDAMSTVSAQRLLVELRYLLAEPSASRALQLLSDLGALQALGLDEHTTGERLALLDRLPEAARALGLESDPTDRVAASLGLLLDAAQLACWLKRFPLTTAEARAARQAAQLAHCPPATLFSTSAESSTLYGALEGLESAALVAAWAAGDATVRANLQRFCRQLAGTEPDIRGQDLIALGCPPGPLFKAALEAALAAKLDRAADRDEQLAVALRVIQGGKTKH